MVASVFREYKMLLHGLRHQCKIAIDFLRIPAGIRNIASSFTGTKVVSIKQQVVSVKQSPCNKIITQCIFTETSDIHLLLKYSPRAVPSVNTIH